MESIPWSEKNIKIWNKHFRNSNFFSVRNIKKHIESGNLIETSAEKLQPGIKYYLVKKDNGFTLQGTFVDFSILNNIVPEFNHISGEYFPPEYRKQFRSKDWKYFTFHQIPVFNEKRMKNTEKWLTEPRNEGFSIKDELIATALHPNMMDTRSRKYPNWNPYSEEPRSGTRSGPRTLKRSGGRRRTRRK